MLHVGQRIKEIFDQQPKNHNIEWFAERLHCKRSNIYNIFSRSTIDTDLLFHISRVLSHDFFRDLSYELADACGEGRAGHRAVYDEIMLAVGQSLSRKLNEIEAPGEG